MLRFIAISSTTKTYALLLSMDIVLRTKKIILHSTLVFN